MSLLSNLRKRQAERFATATPATLATLDGIKGRTVATVATVAVATSPQGQTAKPAKVGAGDAALTSHWWLLHYPDRNPVEVACCPEATQAEILEWDTGAIAADPFEPTVKPPTARITAEEEKAIRAWLELIEETDPAAITEVIEKCQRVADAREYFIGRAAAELPKPDPDDRRTCSQCANLIARRCEGYAPGQDDPDQRHGRERWPGLMQAWES